MSSEIPYPPAPNGYVPMTLYLADRQELKTLLAEVASDVKGIRREMDRDDGAEVVEQAAATAVVESRRSKREVWRDIGLCIFSAGLAVGGAVLVHLLTVA